MGLSRSELRACDCSQLLSASFGYWAARTRFGDAKLFVGFMEYNRISGKGEEGNSGFGRCIYKSMKPKSLRFAKAENQCYCDLAMSQAPSGS